MESHAHCPLAVKLICFLFLACTIGLISLAPLSLVMTAHAATLQRSDLSDEGSGGITGEQNSSMALAPNSSDTKQVSGSPNALQINDPASAKKLQVASMVDGTHVFSYIANGYSLEYYYTEDEHFKPGEIRPHHVMKLWLSSNDGLIHLKRWYTIARWHNGNQVCWQWWDWIYQIGLNSPFCGSFQDVTTSVNKFLGRIENEAVNTARKIEQSSGIKMSPTTIATIAAIFHVIAQALEVIAAPLLLLENPNGGDPLYAAGDDSLLSWENNELDDVLPDW